MSDEFRQAIGSFSDVRISLHTERLRDAREKRGLTQLQLAKLCGLGIKQITRYENDVTEPPAIILARIAHYLGVSTDYLLGLSDSPQSYSDDKLRDDERQLLYAYGMGDSATVVHLLSERMRQLAGEKSE